MEHMDPITLAVIVSALAATAASVGKAIERNRHAARAEVEEAACGRIYKVTLSVAVTEGELAALKSNKTLIAGVARRERIEK